MNKDLEKKINKYLRNRLKPKRYAHCLRVMKFSEELAEFYGADKEKARLAGLLHDSAKGSEEELLKAYDISDIISLEDINKYYAVVHGPLSREIAKSIFGIKDQDVLLAITYHVTGRDNMTLLEKIVFVADAAEPGREYESAKNIFDLAYKDLDEALIAVMNSKIDFCIKSNKVIHPLSIIGRNFYILEKETGV